MVQGRVIRTAPSTMWRRPEVKSPLVEGNRYNIMAIDPELIPLLNGVYFADLIDIAASRAVVVELSAQSVRARLAPPDEVDIRDDVATIASGASVPVRIYQPRGATEPLGVLLFLHGGAFVLGNLESEHDRCIDYVRSARCIVVSVDYRLAPEFAYPAALNDAATTLEWIVSHAELLRADPQRICVGGNSAGGALAAGLALRARDEGGPGIAAQLLLYPVLDDRGGTASMTIFKVGNPWDGDRVRRMWALYLGHEDEVQDYAAPARAHDLANLPTTFILSCEEDPLRDEDLIFAQRLLLAGVSVELHHYRGTYHAFDVYGPTTTVGRQALEEQALFLRRTIGASAGLTSR